MTAIDTTNPYTVYFDAIDAANAAYWAAIDVAKARYQDRFDAAWAELRRLNMSDAPATETRDAWLRVEAVKRDWIGRDGDVAAKVRRKAIRAAEAGLKSQGLRSPFRRIGLR